MASQLAASSQYLPAPHPMSSPISWRGQNQTLTHIRSNMVTRLPMPREVQGFPVQRRIKVLEFGFEILL